MLDIKLIRENPDRVRKALESRRNSFDLEELLRIDNIYRSRTQQLEEIRHRKRLASDEVGRLKQKGESVDRHLTDLRKLSESEKDISSEVGEMERQIGDQLLLIPNVPQDSVPVGDATANKVVRTWGEPKKFSFTPKTHLELVENLKLVDLARAAKVSGSHFILFTGLGARLERALINFMLDFHTTKHGYLEISPPYLVNRATMTGTGQLPKFEEEMYRLRDDELFLIPTAEVPVTNLHAGEILEGSSLPRYYTAYTACFRREAGSYGKETKGMTRVHQFDKVELVKFTTPEASYEEHEKLVRDAEEILQLLELPYRVVVLATGDIGFSASKCYDLEAWSAGTRTWLEVSSCSNFEDFQARRANIRYRDLEPRSGAASTGRSHDSEITSGAASTGRSQDPATKKIRFVHTLNGSGLALARTFIALLEHHQNADGTVNIPHALRPYMDGLERLTPP